MELNPTNAFGELLLDLIEAQYGDMDSGIQAIMDSTGLSEEEVVAIIQGDTIVEDENLLAGIVESFPEADDEDLEVIVNVATSVDAQDRQDLIGQLESDELGAGQADEDNMGMGETEDMAAAAYGYGAVPSAYFSYIQNENNQLKNQISNVNSRLASFEYTNALSSELKNLDTLASRYVDAQLLPPSYKAMLIGDFADENQRVARFAKIATDNGVDVDTMLFATRYALGMLTSASDFVEFKDYSITEDEAAVANFSASLDEVVKSDLDAIFGN
jgi:hypothetical protein